MAAEAYRNPLAGLDASQPPFDSRRIRAVAVVNLNLLRERPRGLSEARPVSYKGESLEERRDRRRARWTPVFGPV